MAEHCINLITAETSEWLLLKESGGGLEWLDTGTEYRLLGVVDNILT